MKSLDQLFHHDDSAWPFVVEKTQVYPGRCLVHPPSDQAADVLIRLQVSTRSPMGAIAYHSGGISVLGGWLRILGSGSAAIPRTLADWNEERSSGYLLIADDVFGGFFALDGGGLGEGRGMVHYFSPRSLRWEDLECTYLQFISWACSDFMGFYDDLSWQGCEAAIAELPPDRCFFFHPPLWTAERGWPPSEIRSVPVHEAWGYQMEITRQLDEAEAGSLED